MPACVVCPGTIQLRLRSIFHASKGTSPGGGDLRLEECLAMALICAIVESISLGVTSNLGDRIGK